MNLLWHAAKYKQLTMHVSLQVMSDVADSMQAIASRSRISPVSIQAAVIPSLELVDSSSAKRSLIKLDLALRSIVDRYE